MIVCGGRGEPGFRPSFLSLSVLILTAALFASPGSAQNLQVLENMAGAHRSLGSVEIVDDRLDLSSLSSLFSLQVSVDLMGERLDLVGSGGSCRFLIGSPLVLSRGLFALLSSPLTIEGGRLKAPSDFLTKALPSLIDRSVSLAGDGSTIQLGAEGSGDFGGVEAEELPRYASFIDRDRFAAPEPEEKRPKGLRVVVLDPGHGGRSDGARGSTGTLEKDLVLAVAQKLKNILEENLEVKVVLTRSADYFVGLKERTAIANNNSADLFLSIHANAAFRKTVRGYETYYLSFSATDLEASQLAQVENKALGVEGSFQDAPMLEAILWDMAQMEYVNQSGELAAFVQSRLVSDVKGKDRGTRQAPLAVLMGARMPAALVEIGFISNPSQEVKLNRDSHQERIAQALYGAIADYNRSLIRGEIRGAR